MTDLTKLTTPLGLLDDETTERLKAHGAPMLKWNVNLHPFALN